MNTRTIELCYMLIDSTQEYSLNSLAQHFEVTPRMIRKDFNAINEFLCFQHGEIILNPSGKVTLVGNRQEIETILNNIGYYDYTLSQYERMIVISLLLLISNDYVTLADCADFMSVSRSTVVKDIADTKDFLQKFQIELVSKPKYGLSIKAKPWAIRDFIIEMLVVHLNEVRRFFSQKHPILRVITNQLTLDMDLIKDIVHHSENQAQTYLAPDSFSLLVYYLYIVLMNIDKVCTNQTDKDDAMTPFLKALLHGIKPYVAKQYINSLTVAINLILNRLNFLVRSYQSDSIIKTQMLTRRFIESISKDLSIDLNRNYQFYENLSNHLSSILNSQNQRIQEFPEIKELIKEKQWLLEVVQKNITPIELISGHVLSEIEIDYIVIYVSVAIEQLKNQVSLRILIVCNSGIATNQLIKERLKQQFGTNSWESMSSHEYHGLKNKAAYDLIITTVYLEGNHEHIINVSPVLTANDLSAIQVKIDTFKLAALMKSTTNHHSNFEKLIENTDEDARVKNNQLVNEFLDSSGLNDIPLLSELLTIDYIDVGVKANNWQEAIKASGQVMLAKGDIEQRYIEAMIDQVKINGPYIVISKGVAVPHGSFNQGTKRVAMSLVKLKEPVYFGIDGYDPVEIVCALSPIDHNQHLRAFFTLVNLLLDPMYKTMLFKATNEAEIFKVITDYERSVAYVQ